MEKVTNTPDFSIPQASLVLAASVEKEDQEAWQEARSQSVGASDAAPLMGEGYKGTSPLTVWESKVAGLNGHMADTFSPETLLLFKRGHMLEPVAAELFLEQNPDLKMRKCGMVRSRKNPYMHANPDGLISDGGGLELKTTNSFSFKRMNQDQVPRIYYWQAVHSLFVTGKTHWWVMVLQPDSFQTLTWRVDASDPQVARDMNLLDLTVTDFWESHVETGTPPEALTVEDLDRHVNADGAVDLDPEDQDSIQVILDRRQELNALAKELKAEQDQLDEALKTMAGENEEVMVGGQFLYRYSPTTRTTLDTKKLKEDMPELWQKYARTRTSRSLAFTPKKK